MNTNSEILVPFDYSKILLKDGLFYTIKDDKYGLIDKEFKVILQNSDDTLFYIYNNNYFLKKGEKWALYKLLDKVEKTPFEFEELNLNNNSFNNFIVRKNGKWGVLNSHNEWLIDAKYSKINFDSVSAEFECLKKNGQNDCFFAN